MRIFWVAFSLVAASISISACSLINSLEATTVVAGLMITTPKITFPSSNGDVLVAPPATGATVFVGQRKSASSTDAPTPVSGASVTVQSGTTSVALNAVANQAGLYAATSGLNLVPSHSYRFFVHIPNDDTGGYGGTVIAPNPLSGPSILFAPTSTTSSSIPGILRYTLHQNLTVTWPQQDGAYAFVAVFMVAQATGQIPTLSPVYDSRPTTSQDFLKLALGMPPANLVIPGSAFNAEGFYIVVLFALSKGDPATNTFLASPLLVGSGFPVPIAIGNPKLLN